ncbi:MAG: hypothetical protein AAF603_05695, partial [Pseudomonadota bacterium]
MFKKPTTIVIGAGTSKDFEVPLGAELLQCIREDVAWRLDNTYGARHPKGDLKADLLSSLFEKWVHRERLSQEELKDTFQKLNKAFDESLSDSIDYFIYLNPAFANILKVLISLNLIFSLYEYDFSRLSWI